MKKINKKFDWGPVSDLMSGLMIVFLFIAVSFMKNQQDQAAGYTRDQESIYITLTEALEPLITEGVISIDDQLTVTFTASIGYFEENRSDILPEFQTHLDSFIPIYINAIQKWEQENTTNKIVEIRVEGHTSSKWNAQTSPEESYFNNMKLSQDRARAVAQYTMSKYGTTPEWAWLVKYFTANGLSSSRLIYDSSGDEDEDKSMRVEFQIRLNSVEFLKKISGEN